MRCLGVVSEREWIGVIATNTMAVMLRFKRGIQYTRSTREKIVALGVTGSPGQAGR